MHSCNTSFNKLIQVKVDIIILYGISLLDILTNHLETQNDSRITFKKDVKNWLMWMNCQKRKSPQT